MIIGQHLSLPAGTKTAFTRENKSSSAFISEILSDLPVAIALLSKTGKILLCNKYFTKVLQTEKSDLIGRRFFTQFKSLEQGPEPDQIDDLNILAETKPSVFKLEFNPRTGGKILVNLKLSTVRKTSLSPSYYIAVIEDITELEKTKRTLDQVLARYETVMKATNDAIWDYTLETGESYYNHAIHEIFGYAGDEIKNNNDWWKSNLHPDDKRRVLKKIDTVIKSNTPFWEDEYRFRCAMGEYKIIEDRCIILRDENGKAFRIIGAMRDITAKKLSIEQNHELQLRQKINLTKGIIEAQELERKRISEELHDNVNQMLATVKLIIDQAKNNDGSNKLLLNKCSKYLTDAISELRNIAHDLSSSWLDNHGLEIAVMKMIGMIKNLKSMSVDLDIDHLNEDDITSHNKLIIFRILQEQIQNILKHSRATEISIIIKYADGRGFIRIADNGIGSKDVTGGDGIGLKNIRSRVEVIAGKMTIATAPGRGYIMEIEF